MGGKGAEEAVEKKAALELPQKRKLKGSPGEKEGGVWVLMTGQEKKKGQQRLRPGRLDKKKRRRKREDPAASVKRERQKKVVTGGGGTTQQYQPITTARQTRRNRGKRRDHS